MGSNFFYLIWCFFVVWFEMFWDIFIEVVIEVNVILVICLEFWVLIGLESWSGSCIFCIEDSVECFSGV